MYKLHDWLRKHWKFYDRTTIALKKLVLPGFGGVPLYYIIKFFIQKLINETVTLRASAIAFNFFLSFIPALIFLFTLLPYIPIHNLDLRVFQLLDELMPTSVYMTIKDTLEDILSNKRGGLLSFGIIFTIYFASNGVFSMMEAFNKNDTRSYFKKRFVALGLVFSLAILLLLGISVFVVGEILLDYLFIINYFENLLTYYILQVSQFFLTMLLVITGISILYFYGTDKHTRRGFFSPGSILATILILATSYGFAFYVDNFSSYNKFYGALGALIAFMLWLYFNSMGLIIGFELNQSIIHAKSRL